MVNCSQPMFVKSAFGNMKEFSSLFITGKAIYITSQNLVVKHLAVNHQHN